MRFHATIQQSGKTATGIEVPPEVIEGLGSNKRPLVRVTINGYTYRSAVATVGGVYMVGVSAENRAGANVAAGDEVEVEIELDTEPREVTVPPDLAAALAGDAKAKRFFDGLSYSAKRRHTLPIEQAKTDATRQKLLAKSMSMLREGRA